MATVFIGTIVVPLPSRFSQGDILYDNAAQVLNDVQIRRLKARLRYMLSHGDINPDGLQDAANNIMAQELVPYATLDDDDENLDPVLEEALTIAREIIISRMAQNGLPPPKGLDLHAKALVDGQPKIQELARKRVEARYRAAQEILEGAI